MASNDKAVLANLALLDTVNFCKENDIDCGGSHLVKNGNGYEYWLVRTANGQPIVSVTFNKYSVPTHRVWPQG